MANLYDSTFDNGPRPTGNAVLAEVIAGKTFSNQTGVDKVGTMPERGAANASLDPGGSYTINEGHYTGGTISAKANTGSFKPTTRDNHDMGASNLNRYVDTTAVPNNNTEVYTFPVGNGDTVDMGVTNNIRSVNANNVYNSGYGAGFEAAKSHIKIYEYEASAISPGPDKTTQSVGHNLVINDNDVLRGKWIIGVALNEGIAGTSTAATTQIRVWYNTDYDGATAENPFLTTQWRDANTAFHLAPSFTFKATIRVFYFE